MCPHGQFLLAWSHIVSAPQVCPQVAKNEKRYGENENIMEEGIEVYQNQEQHCIRS